MYLETRERERGRERKKRENREKRRKMEEILHCTTHLPAFCLLMSVNKKKEYLSTSSSLSPFKQNVFHLCFKCFPCCYLTHWKAWPSYSHELKPQWLRSTMQHPQQHSTCHIWRLRSAFVAQRPFLVHFLVLIGAVLVVAAVAAACSLARRWARGWCWPQLPPFGHSGSIHLLSQC